MLTSVFKEGNLLEVRQALQQEGTSVLNSTYFSHEMNHLLQQLQGAREARPDTAEEEEAHEGAQCAG